MVWGTSHIGKWKKKKVSFSSNLTCVPGLRENRQSVNSIAWVTGSQGASGSSGDLCSQEGQAATLAQDACTSPWRPHPNQAQMPLGQGLLR